ncbi:MAG: methyltransferase domain-containing protein [Candidatus Dadabacteria bacterium]|nr:MAG: methyltransferase domain-containing protein [Candidatus Dadabacteria bacterium]
MEFQELRNLAAGFQPAKLLLVALDVGVFDALAEAPLTAFEAAEKLTLDSRATELCLNALVGMGLLTKAGDRYGLTPPAARWLARGSPDYRGEILRHLHNTWEDWEGLERTWRTGRPALRRKTQQLPSSEEGLRHFILGMENITRDIAPRVAELLPLDGAKTLLDLGAGPGNYCLAFVNRWPGLRAYHFDLPPTSRLAREFVAGKPGAERIAFLEGDFLRDPLGGPYDAVWASQILHMLGEDEVRSLLARIRDALRPGGWVAVHDHFLEPDRTAPPFAALFGVHMLVATERGRTYAAEEIETWGSALGLEPAGRREYGKGPRIVLLRRREP